jgi:hypothetical protein
MPVIARLSSRFYEVVGEDVAQQLVDWLNAVERELTWRADLRLHNELNLARLHTKSKAASSGGVGSLTKLCAPVSQDLTELGTVLRRFKSDLVRWMFGFWVATLLGVAGLLVALRGL